MLITLAESFREAIPVLAIGGGIVFAVIATITGAVRKVRQTKYREESRREIAAYVAEGSMSAEDGAKLLAAKPKSILDDDRW